MYSQGNQSSRFPKFSFFFLLKHNHTMGTLASPTRVFILSCALNRLILIKFQHLFKRNSALFRHLQGQMDTPIILPKSTFSRCDFHVDF